MLKAATIPHVTFLSVSNTGRDYAKLESYLGSLDVKGSAALVCLYSVTLASIDPSEIVEAMAPNKAIVESTGCHTALR